MRKLDLTHDALKFLDGLPPRQFRQVVTRIFALMGNPRPHDSKSLARSDYKRADVGEYRIVYRFERETLFVALVGRRNDSEVYKRLNRES